MLVVGVAPFQEANDSETLTMIMDVKYRVPDESRVSEPCRDLISRMLIRDPAKRASLNQILNHPWVTNSSSNSSCSCQGNNQQQEGDHEGEPLIENHTALSEDERARVLAKMIGGGVVEDEKQVFR